MQIRSCAAAAALVLLSFSGTAQADFTDGDYHAQILYEVDTAKIDVLIVPAASPYLARDLSNIERSVGAWDDGINALGPDWLADGLDIHFHTLGYDEVPEEALRDPEIVILTSEHNPFLQFGAGVAAPVALCRDLDPESMHRHEGSGWGVQQSQCEDGGYQCVVANIQFLGLPDERNEFGMYDLNSHQFGHCLGIGHVGDGPEFSATAKPSRDIMAYGPTGDHVRCVSSLNILALEAIYGHLLGHSGQHVDAGGYVQMDPVDYEVVDCVNPDNPDGLDALAAHPEDHDHPEPGKSIDG